MNVGPTEAPYPVAPIVFGLWRDANLTFVAARGGQASANEASRRPPPRSSPPSDARPSRDPAFSLTRAIDVVVLP